MIFMLDPLNPGARCLAAPSGWHLPSDEEWDELVNFTGGEEIAGTKLKARSGWNSYSGVPAGTDTYGFSALPGGGGFSDGYFRGVGDGGRWWSASEYSSLGAYNRVMGYYGEGAGWGDDDKDDLFSVRCLQD